MTKCEDMKKFLRTMADGKRKNDFIDKHAGLIRLSLFEKEASKNETF